MLHALRRRIVPIAEPPPIPTVKRDPLCELTGRGLPERPAALRWP